MNDRNNLGSVAIFGQGYVGLPLAMLAWDAGFLVHGIDTDLERVSDLQAAHSPSPDVTRVKIRSAINSGRYSISPTAASVDRFDVAIITVPTPLTDGVPNLSFVQAAARDLAPLIEHGATVILESTTYPGTTEELVCPILEAGSGLFAGKDFHVGYSPERIDPGNKQWGLQNTPKVVSGIDNDSLVSVGAFYESLGISVVPVSGTREAELAKLLENTFRHVNIALVNELAMFASTLNTNIWEAIRAAGTKPFGFMGFEPGPGVGGHCLPIDPTYLSWAIKAKSNSVFKFVELANEINSNMPRMVVDQICKILAKDGQEISEAKVLLYGLAYKPGTADSRESPSLRIAMELTKLGARVYALDEYLPSRNWPSDVEHHDRNHHYDIGVILTPHSIEVAAGLVGQCVSMLDTRNVLRDSDVHRL